VCEKAAGRTDNKNKNVSDSGNEKANEPYLSGGKTMKKQVLFGCVLVLAAVSATFAAIGDVSPVGLTGLWTFQGGANWQTGVVGQPLGGTVGNHSVVGPWIEIGTQANPTAYSGNLQVQIWSADKYITVNPAFTANGGGSYVNQYTIAFDYQQTQAGGLNSLFQTAWDPIGSEAELFFKEVSAGVYQVGHDAAGWSTQTFNATNWHRVVIAADNASFFRVYLDGTLFLDAPGLGVDGRYSLYTDRFHLFAGDWNWGNQKWGYCSTIATWNRALSSTEIANMGGWIGGASMPTPLRLVPEPATMSLLTLGGLLALRRSRK